MKSATPSRGGLALLGVAFAVGLAGCAYAIPEVDPADIPRLQQEAAADPENAELQVQLGMAHFKNADYDQALTELQTAADAGLETGPGLLYLGMTHEQFEQWTQAEAAYSRFLEVGRSNELKQAVRDRLQLIGQNVLKQQARVALANEGNIGEPTPRSIAVMPLAYFSDNQDLEPLIYALADMMTTDFAVSNALTVLERANIQSILDEIGLTEDGYADPSTGARAGRLLQAEHVVQGVLTPVGDNVRIQTDILNVPRQASEGGPPTQEDALTNLFDMEKELVFSTINDVLQIELTPAEEQQIRNNRAGNVLAFLAYGRGLRERDRGNYAAAAAQFQQAQQADPSFAAASDAAQSTQAMSSASNTSTNDLANTAASSGETGTGGGNVQPPRQEVVNPGGGTGGNQAPQPSQSQRNADQQVNPSSNGTQVGPGGTTGGETTTQTTTEQRDPVAESQGTDNPSVTPTAQIQIVIRRPGGDER